MPDILGIAEAGMRASLHELDAISRNVANADTQGYKREITLNRGFQAYLAGSAGLNGADGVTGNAAQSPLSGPVTPQQPLTVHDGAAGALKYTGAALSFAIEGRGYFQLQTPQGVVLTRDGQFQTNARGELASADGWPVVLKGNLALDGADVTLNRDGVLKAGDTQAEFDLVDVPDESLQTVGPGRYRGIATPLADGAAHVRQGYVEASNVNNMAEMVRMLGVVRQMESSQQMMRAYDEVIDNAISTLGQF